MMARRLKPASERGGAPSADSVLARSAPLMVEARPEVVPSGKRAAFIQAIAEAKAAEDKRKQEWAERAWYVVEEDLPFKKQAELLGIDPKFLRGGCCRLPTRASLASQTHTHTHTHTRTRTRSFFLTFFPFLTLSISCCILFLPVCPQTSTPSGSRGCSSRPFSRKTRGCRCAPDELSSTALDCPRPPLSALVLSLARRTRFDRRRAAFDLRLLSTFDCTRSLALTRRHARAFPDRCARPSSSPRTARSRAVPRRSPQCLSSTVSCRSTARTTTSSGERSPPATRSSGSDACRRPTAERPPPPARAPPPGHRRQGTAARAPPPGDAPPPPAGPPPQPIPHPPLAPPSRAFQVRTDLPARLAVVPRGALGEARRLRREAEPGGTRRHRPRPLDARERGRGRRDRRGRRPLPRHGGRRDGAHARQRRH